MLGSMPAFSKPIQLGQPQLQLPPTKESPLTRFLRQRIGALNLLFSVSTISPHVVQRLERLCCQLQTTPIDM